MARNEELVFQHGGTNIITENAPLQTQDGKNVDFQFQSNKPRILTIHLNNHSYIQLSAEGTGIISMNKADIALNFTALKRKPTENTIASEDECCEDNYSRVGENKES